jgi:hypothetical protein
LTAIMMAGGNSGLSGIVVMSHVCSSFFEAGVAVRAIARIAPRASAMRFWRRSVGVERDDVAASIARRPPDDAEKGIARSAGRSMRQAQPGEAVRSESWKCATKSARRRLAWGATLPRIFPKLLDLAAVSQGKNLADAHTAAGGNVVS